MAISSALKSVGALSPLSWAIVVGVTTKITQVATSSFFRHSPRWISLMARIEQVPGGQALFSYGPSVVMALITGVVLRLYSNPSMKLYQPMHGAVDRDIQSVVGKPDRSPIFQYENGKCKTYICSNYPKNSPQGHNIFCDAFGYAENDQVQVVALADGCNWGKHPQRTARIMVDGFFKHLTLTDNLSIAKECPKKAALLTQEMIEKRHEENPYSPNYYGSTTFLGGVIFTATNGKRYFSGVNCGDCKLYLLSNNHLNELTKPARVSMRDSGGRFGRHRREEDKTEYPFDVVEVKSGDKLFFMTDGIHDNLDTTPPNDGVQETLGAADQRKLLTLQRLSKDDPLGRSIMDFVFEYTKENLQGMEENRDMRNTPGKTDHMTLLVVEVK